MSEEITGAVANAATGVTFSFWIFDVGNLIALASFITAVIFYFANWRINRARLRMDKNNAVKDYIDSIEDPALKANLLEDLSKRGKFDRRKTRR